MQIPIPGTWGGLGKTTVHDPRDGRYTVTTNATTRFGYMTAGMLAEADATGIASGYRVVDSCFHAYSGSTVVPVILTTNGTATQVYYKTAGGAAWTSITPTGGDTGTAQFAANPGKCITSFYSSAQARNVIIVGFGTALGWYYNNVSGAPDKANWNLTGLSANNSEYMSRVYVQETGLSQARLIWAVDPSSSLTMAGIQIYTTTDIATAASSPTTIAPNTADYCNSITENDLGDLFVGTRNKLYSFDDAGLPVVVAGPFVDPPADAGGQSDRKNFEAFAQLPDSSMLYVVEGYTIIRVRSASDPVTERLPDAAPRAKVDVVGALPRVNLPVSALARAGDWVICALTASTTNLTLANQPGGTNLLQNTLTDGASELYVGKLVGDELVWWGSELTCTDNNGAAMKLRKMWYDPADGYLYLCSGDSEDASHQQRRCYFFLSDPYTRTVSSAIKLSAGTPLIEFAPFDIGENYEPKGGGLITIKAQSLSSTATCTVSLRPQPDYDTSSAFTAQVVYTSAARAERGTYISRSLTFDKLRVRVALGAGSGTAFPRFNGGEVELLPLRDRRAVGAL